MNERTKPKNREANQTMKTNIITTRNFLAMMTLLAAAATAYADTIIPGGAVSGTWNAAGSPYIVQSNITVTLGTGLTIDPGVVVRFQTNVGLEIRGSLVAMGTSANQILFTSDQSVRNPGDWGGIRGISDDVGAASIQLTNCQVEYATDGINGSAHAGGTTTILHLTIASTAVHSCSGQGIYVQGIGSSSYSSTPATVFLSVNGCNCYSNGLSGIKCDVAEGGFASDGYIAGGIRNCIFFRNGQHGMSTHSSYDRYGIEAEISNNVMWGNAASGIDIYSWLNNTFRNNIVVSNAVGISAAYPTGYSFSIFYNDVWGNGANWTGGATPYATSIGNISTDPLCANPAGGDFHLRSQVGRYNPATASWIRDTVTSPCIDAGDPASAWVNEPQPNGGRINMGADGNTLFASKSLPTLTGAMDILTKDFVLSWGCATGETYTVLYSTSPTGPWLDDLPGGQLTAGPSQTVLTYTNINDGTLTNRFYRVRWNTP